MIWKEDCAAWVTTREVVQAAERSLRQSRVPAGELEDLRQSVLVQALQVRVVPADLNACKALVQKIGKDVAASYFRKGQTRGKHDAGPCDHADECCDSEPSANQRDPIDTRRQLACIERAVDAGWLQGTDLQILALTAEGVGPAAIAEELGLPRQSVRNRLSAIRKLLRESWEYYLAAATVAVAIAILLSLLAERANFGVSVGSAVPASPRRLHTPTAPIAPSP